MLWSTIMKDYGGVRVIKMGAVNVLVTIKFIQCR